ncbi:MAG: aldehyde dehydrogenase family protein [Actinomycetota bacterium]|jgi:phenylacetaldehyde dehydrogenase|nr:aldehyde dehydrogenase family protein [Actinomycetota bacterium]MDA8279357.1 aldehyde dehydrogenase family protein [Actinomycetota bacterium]
MTLVAPLADVSSFLGRSHRLWIGGQWEDAADGRTFVTDNPATGNPLATVARAGAGDVDRAVRAARRAFDDGRWSAMAPSARSRIVWRIGDLILEHTEELAQLETLDNGKPLSVARAGDVPMAADLFHYMAGWVTKLEGNTLPVSLPGEFHAYTRREPVGVVGQIVPWNFPLALAAWKLAPALATGNCIVLKPAEDTPLTALRLAELIAEAGVPDGVLNVITGFGEDAGAALVAHDDVDKVSFTGSTEVGRSLVRAAAGNLKRLTLELGGKSPNIILEDADVEAAIRGAADGIFFNQGEACVAGSRLFVHRRIADDVVAGIADIARQMRLGDGMALDTEMGPVVSQTHQNRVSGYIRAGLEEGATLVAGDEGTPEGGWFVRPTVFSGVRPDMRIVREEIFGPVVSVTSFDDDDQAVAMANDTRYGLAAGIWGRDLSRVHRLAARIKAGTVWVNCYGVLDASMPFGGYKESGWGREHGHQVLSEYTETKSVCIQL